MARRKSASDGTVFQDKSGRWVAMLELPRRPDGRRHRKKRQARTQAEAKQLLREMQDEFNETQNVADTRRTVNDAIATYREARKAQGLAEGTLAQNKWQLDVIAQGMGAARLSKLTVADCDRFLEAAARGLGERRPIARAHISRIRFVLINVLANEMRVGHLMRNVAELSILPATTAEKKERRALTSDQLSALLALATGSRLVLIDLMARNGLRPAEARGLRWADVDMELGQLTISGQVDRQNRRTKPKTKKSARSLQLDETTLGRLETWRVEQEEMRAAARNAWNDEPNIVASTARGNPVDRHAFARSLRGYCNELGIDPPVTPYELRHTAITMQADSGHSSWEIADWAGTSEAMISDVYRHRLRRLSGLLPVAAPSE